MQEENNVHITSEDGVNNTLENTQPMPTNTTKPRKWLTPLVVVLIALSLLIGGTLLALYNSKVQTYIVGQVAEKLSEKLSADVSIKHIHYRPLNHLTVDSLYISDQQMDTLLFVEQAHISINLLGLVDDRLDLTEIALKRPYINLQTMSDSTLNCQFLLDMVQQTDTATSPLRVNIDKLQLTDVRFRYNELLVDQLQLDLTLPVFSSDSLDIRINHLALHAQLDQLDAEFKATLHGDLDSIFADEMLLVYREKRIFDGDIAVYHPTKLDSLYVQAHCNDLYCNYALLQDALSKLQSKPIHLPKPIAQLGQVHYHGAVNGRIEHLNLHGAFTSALGSMKVNGYLETDSTLQHIDFVGHLSTNKFQIGKLF